MADNRFACLALAASLVLLAGASHAQDPEAFGLADKVTPVCEVAGIEAPPPEGWFNLPIESANENVRGCQMMLARADDKAVVGIARVLSIRAEGEMPPDPPWWAVVIGVESQNIAELGFRMGDVLWTREDVTLAGSGFTDARSVGVATRVEGNPVPQEAHFVVFQREDVKYVITLLTPAERVEGGVYYQRNTADFEALVRDLTAASG